MTDFAAYLATFGALAALIWGAIHGFQRLSGISDRALAWIVCVVGILGGVVSQGVGFVPSPSPPPWSWIASGFFGLISAFAGTAVSDLNLAAAIKPKPKSKE